MTLSSMQWCGGETLASDVNAKKHGSRISEEYYLSDLHTVPLESHAYQDHLKIINMLYSTRFHYN